MGRALLVIGSVSAAIAAAAQAGCYWPIPSCEESVQKTSAPVSGQITVNDDGTFQVDARSYASCTEFCGELDGVREVLSCEAPKQIALYEGGPLQWKLSCEVDLVQCRQAKFLSVSFGHGRRPEGLAAAGNVGASVGSWLAEAARLEAASVPAFERLARELEAHGAPRDLVRRARRAMSDEQRHARVTARLARAHGGAPFEEAIGELPVRDLDAVALENAVEGCVAETLAAIVATYQASHARDPRVRSAYRRIARDETAHAALAWDVLAWCERPAALTALRRAASRLSARSIAAPDVAMRDVLGLPDSAAAERILAAARALLWNAVA